MIALLRDSLFFWVLEISIRLWIDRAFGSKQPEVKFKWRKVDLLLPQSLSVCLLVAVNYLLSATMQFEKWGVFSVSGIGQLVDNSAWE
ncbi:hypothetical protein CEXT_390031 [Caerostris extrusa]|uniref:Uncharacterized protein n=1 Tax=Caerostris extrusa TaxID=172846 RepID=A0AAV4XY32_CAEEX|nr:hypothetical protein CEXT_390031 [Caerostris extrusa]